MSEEKDIELLEDYIKSLKLTPEELLKNNEIIKFIEYKEIQAIENLINRVKELEKYEEYYKDMEEVNKKFIAVDKIKEKIEELEKEQKECILYKHSLNCEECMERCEIFSSIEVLKELMEE